MVDAINNSIKAPVGLEPNQGDKIGFKSSTGKVDFGKALKEAISSVNNVQKDANDTVKSFAQGKASIHETMVAVEKAGISFQLMLQVRNKIVTAYEDIMRTQI